MEEEFAVKSSTSGGKIGTSPTVANGFTHGKATANAYARGSLCGSPCERVHAFVCAFFSVRW